MTNSVKASVKDRVLRAGEVAGTRLREGTASARKAAGNAYDSARERTDNAIHGNPLVALLGGLAVGAAIGAIIPRLRGEKAYLGGIGGRINQGARKAADMGREKLDEIGLNAETAREKVGDLLDRAVSAIAPKAKGEVAPVTDPAPKIRARKKS